MFRQRRVDFDQNRFDGGQNACRAGQNLVLEAVHIQLDMVGQAELLAEFVQRGSVCTLHECKVLGLQVVIDRFTE